MKQSCTQSCVRACVCVLYMFHTHGCCQVDGHQWVAGDEEVVESHDETTMWELTEYVAVPCDEPTQREYGPYFRPETIMYTVRSLLQT